MGGGGNTAFLLLAFPLFLSLLAPLAAASIIRSVNPTTPIQVDICTERLCYQDEDCKPEPRCVDGTTLAVQNYKCENSVPELGGGRCVKDGGEEEDECGAGQWCFQSAGGSLAGCGNIPLEPEECEIDFDCGEVGRFCGSSGDRSGVNDQVVRETPQCVSSPTEPEKKFCFDFRDAFDCREPDVCHQGGIDLTAICGPPEDAEGIEAVEEQE